MMKNQKGITLIALVITIIVLLILAGIAIAMLTGDNGIITNAQKARSNTAYREADEQMRLAYMAVRTEIAAHLANDTSYSATTEVEAQRLCDLVLKDLKGFNGNGSEWIAKVENDDTTGKPVAIYMKCTSAAILIGTETDEVAPKYDGRVSGIIYLHENGRTAWYDFDIDETSHPRPDYPYSTTTSSKPGTSVTDPDDTNTTVEP